MLHPPERHFSKTGFTSYNSNSVMQKSDVPVVTCVDCSPVEVVVGEELFALARGEIETGHETESKCKNGKKKKKQMEEDEEKEQRVGDKDHNIGSILSMSCSLLSSSTV